jgi:hypothetical protein
LIAAGANPIVVDRIKDLPTNSALDPIADGNGTGLDQVVDEHSLLPEQLINALVEKAPRPLIDKLAPVVET